MQSRWKEGMYCKLPKYRDLQLKSPVLRGQTDENGQKIVFYFIYLKKSTVLPLSNAANPVSKFEKIAAFRG